MLAALRFKVTKDYNVDIYPAGFYDKVDWGKEYSCSLGSDYSAFKFNNQEECSDIMSITTGLDGREILRLIETKRYIIRVKSNTGMQIELPKLQNEENKSLKLERDENTLTFQFINYLGRSKITFPDCSKIRELSFEVIPDKMDFEDDYIELTEAIAKRCSELLLEYSGTTSNVFSLANDDSKTLLEQFIFLRQFCFSDNLQSLFEAIKRNPDRILVEEEDFQPFGCGVPSKKIYSHPFKYGKNWCRYNSTTFGEYYLPTEIVVSHKRNNLDTQANRFLKFSLEQFNIICVSLIDSLEKNGTQKQTECLNEAKLVHSMINDILRDSFFDEVGILNNMPQNNQILQKREGYSQIFAAYSMIDLALQLDWSGKDAVYDGESKNVALLYEYWLFFELRAVIGSIDGCIMKESNENSFISTDKDKLTISLSEGNLSCQSFHIPSLETKINLYYNRTFTPIEFRTTKYEGSYSRPFRPDYTLAIFSDRYNKGKLNGENEAIKDGAVSYIHFDAKYRITDLTSFVGKMKDKLEEENIELDEEKAEEIVNTYKRGDLLKMHTYNDAIRRTVGSYVLYPGNCDMTKLGGHIFSLYDEILPGVGAFAIKPSIRTFGEAELKKFITNLILEKTQDSSRLNRLKYYSEMILREPPSFKIAKSQFIEVDHELINHSKYLCVIGYIRAEKTEDYYYYLLDSGYLKNGAEFYFYYYAIKNGIVYSHHFDIAKAGRFRFYINEIRKTDVYHLEPIICTIETNELISKVDLVQKLKIHGYLTDVEHFHADFYYVMKLKVINDSASKISLKVNDVNAFNGNDSFSPHSPKILPFDLVDN